MFSVQLSAGNAPKPPSPTLNLPTQEELYSMGRLGSDGTVVEERIVSVP